MDFVVCLGGDGTILHASSLFQRAIPPVISFSAGSLGFLTNHSLANVESDLRAVIYGSEDLDQCSLEEDVSSHAHLSTLTRNHAPTLSAYRLLFSQTEEQSSKNPLAWTSAIWKKVSFSCQSLYTDVDSCAYRF